MKIKCTLAEFASLVLACSDMTCATCILNDMCDGTGIENFILYEDIIHDDPTRTGGETDV